MLSTRRFSWLAVALALASTSPSWSTTVAMMSDQSLAAQAEVVIVARSLGTLVSPELERPVTDYLMSVERVMKGSVDAGAIVVRVPGGIAANGMGLKIWGAPEFQQGERAILFLNRAGDGTYRILQLVLGSFREAPVGGHLAAYRDFSEVQVLDATSATSRDELRLREFDRFADWLADFGAGRVLPRQYFFRADEGVSSTGNTLLPMYTLFEEDGKNMRWFDFDRGTAVGWRMDPDGFPGLGSSGQAEFEAAMAMWNNEPQTPINYQYRGTSGLVAGFQNFDGQNVLLFGDPNDDVEGSFSCPSGGTLAVGGPWYDTGTTAVFDGRTFIRIQGADIVLNDGVECYFQRPGTPSLAAQELLAHELGHTLGLGHSSENPSETNTTLRDALMYYRLHNDGRGASLRSDDLAAIHALYTVGGGGSSGGGGGGGGSNGCPAGTLCLLNGRFRVTAVWNNQFDGSSGSAGPIPNTDLAGFLYFTDPSNIELIVKMLDFGDRFLFFYGQLTNLHFTITVVDTVTGRQKTYSNTTGDCGALDDNAFTPSAAPAGMGRFGDSAAGTLLPTAACIETSNSVCLLGGRFRLEADWRNQFDGSSGLGIARKLSNLTAAFAFTDPSNLEILVKTLDFGDHVLVLYGTLSNLEYTLRVTELATGAVRTYHNAPGNYCGGLDQNAF